MQAVIKVKNDNNECFHWDDQSAWYPVYKIPQQLSKYKTYKTDLML